MVDTGHRDIHGTEVRVGDRVSYISRVRSIGGEKKIETGTIVCKRGTFKIDMDNPSWPDERFYSLNQKNLEVIGDKL